MEISFKRAAYAPTGLAAFLSRVTGMDIVRSKLHNYQDRKREAARQQVHMQIEEQNRIEKLQQQHEHSLEMLEMRRIENEQKKSFEREQVAHYSKGYGHMPSVHLALTPRGRMAMPAKALRRHYAPTVKEGNVKAPIVPTPQQTPTTTETPAAETSTTDDYISFADNWDKHSSGGHDFIAPDPDKDKGRSR